MASINITNAPSRNTLSMQSFRSVSDDLGGLARACRFIVRILPQGRFVQDINEGGVMTRDLIYLTEMAEIPGRGFMNIDLRYYGPSFKLPFQTTYEDLNLGFICRAESLEREFFDNWMTVINPINTWDFNYRDDYRSRIEIFQFSDVEHTPTYKATIHNAYPILVNQQPLLWTDDQFMKLIVSFTYTHWSREGIDPEPN